MNTKASADDLYREWGVLTLQEAQAIDTESWDLLGQLQRRKAELKLRIVEIDYGAAGMPGALKSRVGELVGLERQNLETLRQRMDRLRGHMDDLDLSRRNLHRIRGAYRRLAPKRTAAFGTA